MGKLTEIASRLRITPAVLVQVIVVDLLARPQEGFEAALAQVLSKNAELYRRLA